jgi:hypothetical protein
VNVRDHPADLCEFESGDGVIDTAHVWLLLGVGASCVHNGDVLVGLTTQAQRPGPRGRPIATTTRWPGSLQRMVRPRS